MNGYKLNLYPFFLINIPYFIWYYFYYNNFNLIPPHLIK